MKALSILQPWAWLIVRPDVTDPAQRAEMYRTRAIKDIENRTWHTPFRGQILVHAGKKLVKRDYWDDLEYFYGVHNVALPSLEELQAMCGGFLGTVTITDCVRRDSSPWKVEGQWGFVLEDAQPMPFVPYKGQLGFFEVDTQVLHQAKATA